MNTNLCWGRWSLPGSISVWYLGPCVPSLRREKSAKMPSCSSSLSRDPPAGKYVCVCGPWMENGTGHNLWCHRVVKYPAHTSIILTFTLPIITHFKKSQKVTHTYGSKSQQKENGVTMPSGDDSISHFLKQKIYVWVGVQRAAFPTPGIFFWYAKCLDLSENPSLHLVSNYTTVLSFTRAWKFPFVGNGLHFRFPKGRTLLPNPGKY